MYSIFLLITLTLILIIFLTLIFQNKFNYIFSLILSLFIIYLIINPVISINSAIDGLTIFMKSIFPTLLPFLFCCNMLIYTNAINLYNKLFGFLFSKLFYLSQNSSFAVISSYLCGYPIGAKYSTTLFENKKITKSEFSRLISIASNASPLFLTSVVATSMLNNHKLGYLLLISSYFSSLIIALFLIKKEDSSRIISNSSLPSNIYSFGESIKQSIEDSMLTLINLCGYIVIFSILIGILQDSIIFNNTLNILSNLFGIPSDILTSFSLGLLELTNGCKLISTLDIALSTKLCIISFLASFGGLSIITQTFSFFSKHKISFKKYFFLKFLQGLISATLMFFLCKVFFKL
ncbi:sporulation integral membrane protein YlbJ [uncultured Clostridium sp.]|uniref:sporulation integral membrane protein YlbJ n=1 Tax=uncultured Clostridium sp. TaxID=59620 RepID=UPI002633E75B|nr:sporulation integral membrane protein YlbJ [uncultured Clostridium sp.]